MEPLLREALQDGLRRARAVQELGVCSAPGVPWGALTELPLLLPGCLQGEDSLPRAEARTLLGGFFQDPNLKSGTGGMGSTP